MKKAKRKSETTKSIIVKKYPFDPDNDEKHELTPDEISRLEPGSGGKAEAWTNPSQYDYDKLRERLLACGIKTDSLKSYSITDAVRALREGYPKSIKQVYEIEHAEASDKWEDRYASVVTASNRLRHWHEREKNILNRLVKTNNEHLAKNKNPSVEDARVWLSEIWPFGEHCERLYKVPDDLDAVYLAVGLRLDTLFRARNLVTDEMVKVIIGEWQLTIKQQGISEYEVFCCSFPYFNGINIAYDDPLELFWGYIEADLQAHGFDPKHTGNNDKWPDKDYTAAKYLWRDWKLSRSTVDYWWARDKTKLKGDKINGPRNQVAFKNMWIKEKAKEYEHDLKRPNPPSPSS